jgi:cytochrome c-type biogenesis protein CcmH
VSADWNRRIKGRAGWLVILFAAVAVVAVGASRQSGPSTPEERAAVIARQLACPTCEGESVYESSATSAVNIRNQIGRLVDEGRLSDDEIVAELEVVYGEQLSLVPSGTGINSLAWALPVAAAVAGATGLIMVFRKWRRDAAATAGPTDEDRLLVAAALAARADEGRSP